MSQKYVSKQKRGTPLDQLLEAQATGDDARLERLRSRYRGAVVPASSLLSQSPRLIGYARVSTDDQTTRLQLDALRAAGCAQIFEDTESGAHRSRRQFDLALAELCAGDTLVVWKLDRLGRSLRNLLDVADTLRDRDVALRSLTEHIDTSTAAGKMLYAVLGAVAQFERDAMRERTVAGMRAAKSRGEHVGRPVVLTPSQIREAQAMRKRGEGVSHIARVLRVSRATLYRAILN